MSFISQIKKGFTLIELMVSIGIMMFITSTVLLNQGTYTSSVSLSNLVSDVGLSIRQAQIYGISVMALPSDSTNFTSAYGIDFNIVSNGSNEGSKTSYIFFADKQGTQNGYYDYSGRWSDCPTGGASECLKKIDITNGNSISQMCLLLPNGNPRCIIDRLDITFLRPDTKASFQFFTSGGMPMGLPPSLYSGARIIFTSLAGGSRYIDVYSSGQISVH